MFGLSASDRERLQHVEDRLGHLEVLLERLDVALTVRDPGNARSADAYDGLRKSIAAAGTDRRQHTTWLAELHDRVTRGTATSDLVSLVDEWTQQARLVRDNDGARLDAYDIVGGKGEGLSVLRPAWIDDVNQSVVRRGQAERFQIHPASDSSGDDQIREPESDRQPTEEDLAYVSSRAHIETDDGTSRPSETPRNRLRPFAGDGSTEAGIHP